MTGRRIVRELLRNSGVLPCYLKDHCGSGAIKKKYIGNTKKFIKINANKHLIVEVVI